MPEQVRQVLRVQPGHQTGSVPLGRELSEQERREPPEHRTDLAPPEQGLREPLELEPWPRMDCRHSALEPLASREPDRQTGSVPQQQEQQEQPGPVLLGCRQMDLVPPGLARQVLLQEPEQREPGHRKDYRHLAQEPLVPRELSRLEQDRQMGLVPLPGLLEQGQLEPR